MKNRKRNRPDKPAQPQAAPFSLRPWHVALGLAAAFVAAFTVYQPALNGPFVFDDVYLPFYSHDFGEKPFVAAIRGVRPLLMLSFWINHRISGLEPHGYHVLNLLFHIFTSLFVFLIARKILEWAGEQGGRREWLAAFGGGLFLLHPVQTESVAYVASRSESLSVLFFCSALALFLYRKPVAVSWRVAVGILLLFGAAASTKEHTIALPALLLLTDYWWNPGFSFEGARRNWRLYSPLVLGGAAAVYSVWRVLRHSSSAGFGVEGFSWYSYFFTEWRALWVYFRLFVFPAGQNADYVFPISRTPMEHGALLGLAGLLVLVACAVYFRRRFPLAAYGFLAALVLFAPTSSLVPIQDPVVERRLYLPMVALVLVVLESVRRLKSNNTVMAGTLAAVLVAAGTLTYARCEVWGNETALWEDVISKSPRNPRAHFQLAVAAYEQGRCDVATKHYETVAQLEKPGYQLLLNWALAEDCLNRPEAALDKLYRAVKLRPTAHAYSQIGMVLAKRRRLDEALAVLNKAIETNPRFGASYVYRGNVYVLSGNIAGAVADYRRALEIDPNNQAARNALGKIESRLRGVQ